MFKDALICLMTGQRYTDHVGENLLIKCVFKTDSES